MRKVCALTVLVLLIATTSWAVPITFIHRALVGEFQGTLGGNAFSVSEFTITAFGDTDDRQNIGVGFSIDHTSAQIELPGLGIFQFVTPTRTFVNQNNNAVGFSRAPGGTDLFSQIAFDPTAYTAYNFLSSIGPELGDGSVLQWIAPAVLVSDGTERVLTFDDSIAEVASFQAIVQNGGQAPEPTTLLLLGAGLVGIWHRRRRS